MRAWTSRLGWIALAACTTAAFAEDATLTRVREREWALAKGLVNDFYDVANGYFQNGYRREAAHFMQRCAELAPDNAFVASLARTLADFDHPLWKKRRWRSPKGAADEAFRRRVASMDARYRKVLVAQGNASFDEKAESYKERAHGFYLKALRSLGGPFELDAKQQLQIDTAVIPAAASARLIDGELVEVNGALYFRDSMLRCLKDVAAVREARGERSLVRTIAGAGSAGDGPLEQHGAGLARLLDAAWGEFEKRSGQHPAGTLGLFVFPDRAAFQAFCDQSGKGAFRDAHGLTSVAEGFSVTFAGEHLEEIAVHEAAHLFHWLAYGTNMPSWYDEGMAASYSWNGTMRWQDGALATCLPLAAAALAPLLEDGGMIPLDRFVRANASEFIAAGPQESARFYAQSWALYNFLQETRDPRFAEPFERWESFALGSGAAPGGKPQSLASAELFDAAFAGRLPELEQALRKWLSAR